MDFASLMAQIHSSGLEESSVEDLVALSNAASDEEDFAFEDTYPGIDVPALRDFMVDYLDMMAVGGVAGASYSLVEVDNLLPFQLVDLAKQYGVDLDQFKLAE